MSRQSSYHPDNTIQKALVSTPSRLTGEFAVDGLLVTHSWPPWEDLRRAVDRSLSRAYFVIAFRTQPVTPQPGTAVPDWGHSAEIICSLLTVLYGKRFDFHGSIENEGMYRTPDLSIVGQDCDPTLPFNSHQPRATATVPLNLTEISHVSHMIFSSENQTVATILSACRFYMLALRIAEAEPEIAYLHLVTSGEILSRLTDLPIEDLMANSDVEDLETIASKVGAKFARRFRGRLSSIRRRFTLSLCVDLDAEFFANPEPSVSSLGTPFLHETVEDSVDAAYSLRSRFLHSGEHFGKWVEPRFWRHDLHVGGMPLTSSKEFSKVLQMAPKFVGLERLIRYRLRQSIDSIEGSA